MYRILTFGTFDGLHDGHRAMLREAKNLATNYQLLATSYLIVAVAPNSVVLDLKGCMPRHTSAQRIAMLKAEHLADEVILGDAETSSWKVVKKYKPQIIALGYDQQELKEDLEAYLEKTYPDAETKEGACPEPAEGEWKSNPKRPIIKMLAAYKPERHHSRIMNKE